MGNQAQNKKKHFHLFQIPMLKKPDFNVKLKLLIHFNFSQFHEHIFKSSCRRYSSNYVLLKILQYSELKRDSNTGVFQ